MGSFPSQLRAPGVVALEFASVPFGQVGGNGVGRVEECQEHGVGIVGGDCRGIGEGELAEFLEPLGLGCLHLCARESVWGRLGASIEDRLG